MSNHTGNRRNFLDSFMLGFGFIVGIIMGAILMLLNLKRDGKSNRKWLLNQSTEIKQQIESADVVNESIKQGKQAAKEHREKAHKI